MLEANIFILFFHYVILHKLEHKGIDCHNFYYI